MPTIFDLSFQQLGRVFEHLPEPRDRASLVPALYGRDIDSGLRYSDADRLTLLATLKPSPFAEDEQRLAALLRPSEIKLENFLDREGDWQSRARLRAVRCYASTSTLTDGAARRSEEVVDALRASAVLRLNEIKAGLASSGAHNGDAVRSAIDAELDALRVGIERYPRVIAAFYRWSEAPRELGLDPSTSSARGDSPEPPSTERAELRAMARAFDQGRDSPQATLELIAALRGPGRFAENPSRRFFKEFGDAEPHERIDEFDAILADSRSLSETARNAVHLALWRQLSALEANERAIPLIEAAGDSQLALTEMAASLRCTMFSGQEDFDFNVELAHEKAAARLARLTHGNAEATKHLIAAFPLMTRDAGRLDLLEAILGVSADHVDPLLEAFAPASGDRATLVDELNEKKFKPLEPRHCIAILEHPLEFSDPIEQWDFYHRLFEHSVKEPSLHHAFVQRLDSLPDGDAFDTLSARLLRVIDPRLSPQAFTDLRSKLTRHSLAKPYLDKEIVRYDSRSSVFYIRPQRPSDEQRFPPQFLPALAEIIAKRTPDMSPFPEFGSSDDTSDDEAPAAKRRRTGEASSAASMG